MKHSEDSKICNLFMGTDYTFCSNSMCLLSPICVRNTQHYAFEEGDFFSYAEFQPDECDIFIEGVFKC